MEYYGQGGGLNLGMYGTRHNFADSRGYMFGMSGCNIAVRAPPGIHPATRWIRGQWAHIVGVHRGDNCTLHVVPQGEWEQYGDAFVGRINARQAVEGNGPRGSTLGFRPAIGCRGHHTGDACEGGNSQGINPPHHGKMTQHYSWKRALEDAEVATLLKPAYGNDAAPNLDQHGTPRACTTHCGRWINGGSGGEHPMFEDCMYMPPGSGGREGGGGQDGPGHIHVFGHDLLCCPEGWEVTGGNAAVAGVTGSKSHGVRGPRARPCRKRGVMGEGGGAWGHPAR